MKHPGISKAGLAIIRIALFPGVDTIPPRPAPPQPRSRGVPLSRSATPRNRRSHG